MSLTDLRTRVLRASQIVVPRRSRAGVAPPSALYFWNEIEPRERDVELGVVRVVQQHEFAVTAPHLVVAAAGNLDHDAVVARVRAAFKDALEVTSGEGARRAAAAQIRRGAVGVL